MKKTFILSSPSYGVYNVLMRVEHDNATPLLDLIVLSFADYAKARETVDALDKAQALATF